MHLHKWENLGMLFLLDAHQFFGGMDFTGYNVRRCLKCPRYQYKFGSSWKDCEISGNYDKFYLCESGFRREQGLPENISPYFVGSAELSLVRE